LDGITGFACEIGDVEDMTKKALFILDKDNLPGFKERALARAKEFDIDQILPMYEDYYRKTIALAEREKKMS
jgi:glycosyltransferase involved in cell wall biosynthesis